MRLTAFLGALGATLLAWSASAQPAESPAVDLYLSELAGRCPASQLQLLSPSQLRDGLDDFAAGLTPENQEQMRKAEAAQCSAGDDGAICVNSADIGVIDQLDLTTQFATSICEGFLRCRSQGDCDRAR